MNILVEPATASDFEMIADLNVRCYNEFAPALTSGSWELMQENLRNIAERAERAQFLIVHSGGQIVGSVGYCPAGNGNPAVFGPEMASVILLAVDPAHRGMGIAKSLMAACIARAREEGASSIALFTSEIMLAAQHIYRSLGFRLESELPMRLGVRYFLYVLALDKRDSAYPHDLRN